MFDSNKKIVYQDTLDEYHKRISALIGTGGSQISTIPTASEDYENVIYQYIGETDSTYTNGYFYKCIEDPDNAGEYIWVNERVQDGGSSDGGHEIKDSSYSTEEKIVGTWIDKKPVYQRTWTGLNIQTKYNTWVEVATVPNIEFLIDWSAFSDTTCFSSGGYECEFGDGKIRIESNQNVNLRIIKCFTARYTKTTDA